MWVMTEKILH